MIEQVYSKERLLQLHKAGFFGNGTLNTGLVALKQGKLVMVAFPDDNPEKDLKDIVTVINNQTNKNIRFKPWV